MKNTGLRWCVLLIVLLVWPVFGEVHGAETSRIVAMQDHLQFWNIPVRLLGRGGATASTSRGAEALTGNPAGLGRTFGQEFEVQYQWFGSNWLLTDGAIVTPYGERHSLGFGLSILDLGDIEPSPGDGDLRPQGSEARLATAYGYEPWDGVYFGGNFQYVTSKIDFLDRKSTVAINLGSIWEINEAVTVGSSFKNLFGNLEVDSGVEKTPLEARIGMDWKDVYREVNFAGDIIYDGGEETTGVGLGFHREIISRLDGMIGYHSVREEQGGATLGVRWKTVNLRATLVYSSAGPLDSSFTRAGVNIKY